MSNDPLHGDWSEKGRDPVPLTHGSCPAGPMILRSDDCRRRALVWPRLSETPSTSGVSTGWNILGGKVSVPRPPVSTQTPDLGVLVILPRPRPARLLLQAKATREKSCSGFGLVGVPVAGTLGPSEPQGQQPYLGASAASVADGQDNFNSKAVPSGMSVLRHRVRERVKKQLGTMLLTERFARAAILCVLLLTPITPTSRFQT